MKLLIFSAIIAMLAQVSFAQMGGINLPGGGRNTGGLGGATGNNPTDGTGGRNLGTGGVGGQANTGGAFGGGFNFDPRFNATTFGNPFGAAGGGIGNRMGNMGMGGLGMGGMGGMGMGMGGMGMGGMGFGRGMGGFGMGGMGMQQQQQSKLRPTVRLGFEVERPSAVRRSQQVQMRLSRLPQAQRFSGVDVVMDGSRAIATGSLANPADAGLLRQLLLLEPGVYEVDISQLNAASDNKIPESIGSAPELVPSDSLVPPPRN
jgi:hypothetical protein